MRVLFLKILYPLLALSSFVNPFYGLLNYIFISIIRPEQLTHGVPQVSNVFAFSIVCLVSSCIVHRISLFLFRHSFFLMYLLYVLAFFISTYSSSYTSFSEQRGSLYYLYQLPQIMAFCICMFAILINLDRKYLDFFLSFMLFLFFLMALWGIQQRFHGNILMERLFGNAITDRNAIAGVYLLQLGLVSYFIKTKNGLLQKANIVYAILFVAMVVLTQSRAGFLGLCTLTIMVVYKNRNSVKLVLCLLFCMVLFLLFTPDFYSSRVSTIKMQNIESAAEITDYSSASRLVLWSLAIDVFTDHPFLGVGNLNYRDAAFEYANQYVTRLDPYLYDYVFGYKRVQYVAHNTYLSILAESGIAGALPFLLMIIIPLFRGGRAIKIATKQELELVELQKALMFGLVGFLATAFFSNQVYLDYMYWFLTLSFLVSIMMEQSVRVGIENSSTGNCNA